MSADNDLERIAVKAHEIWESEGRPHGRDQAHWDQAKEIIALHDSMCETLLPRSSGAFEPEEPTQDTEAYGDMPGLADQGRDDLLDTDREPEITKPSHATHSLGDTAGHVARSKREETPDIDDGETVTPALKVAAVTPTPSNPMLGVPAPRRAEPAGLPPVASPSGASPAATDDAKRGSTFQASPVGNSAPVTAKAPPKPAAPPAPVTKGRR